jgi:predicted NAD-dependent protein-ADP-ribosyltransferase YbiA (DUF1768 family)
MSNRKMVVVFDIDDEGCFSECAETALVEVDGVAYKFPEEEVKKFRFSMTEENNHVA